MTSYKKISFTFALAILFQLTNCAENNEVNPSALDILKEKYEYNIDQKEEVAPAYAQDEAPKVTVDKVNSHYFDTGLTRTKVTKKIKNGSTFITTEKWITKHSSKATWMNMMLGSIVMLLLSDEIMHRTIRVKYPTQSDYRSSLLCSFESGITDSFKSVFQSGLQFGLKSGKNYGIKFGLVKGLIFAYILTPLIAMMYNYLSDQEKLNKEIVEKETKVLERELMALQTKELETLAQEPQL